MSVLGANAHDLAFDFATADAVANAFENAANSLDRQGASRQAHENTAGNHFRGFFAEVFHTNMSTARTDRSEVTDALRSVAKGIHDIAQAAREENNRRRVAREYVMKYDDWWEKAWSWFVGQEAPPRMDVNPAPVITASVPLPTVRETPGPGSYAHNSVTSANPVDLRTAANGLKSLDEELSNLPSSLESHMGTFASLCQFGTMDASGPIRGLRDWLRYNDDDVRWLNLLAGEFESAGSDGVVSVPNAALHASLESAGVDAYRSDLSVEPATISGIEPTTGYTMDPVNVATGNFVEEEHDLTIGEITFTRMYNSISGHTSWFGPGWYSILDEVIETDDEVVRWYRHDGRITEFEKTDAGTVRGVRSNVWLTKAKVEAFAAGGGTASQAIVDNAGNRRLFDGEGRLLGFDYDRTGGVALDRDESGRVVGLRDERGRSITVIYEDQRVVGLEASDGRRITYTYDEGFVSGVVSAYGTRSYTWADGLIEKIISASGTVEVDNSYKDGKVVRQLTPQGRDVKFAYLPGRVTVSMDHNGERADTWVSDRFGRLIKIIDSAGNTQSMVYDRYSNLIQFTDREGNTVTSRYTDRGLLSSQVSNTGDEVTYRWDDLDRLAEVVDVAGGLYTFSYVGDTRRISAVTDPGGGVSRMTWNGARLDEVVDPSGVSVRFGYDDDGNMISISNALGETRTFERDEFGYIVAEISPRGGRKSYGYNDAGALATFTNAVGDTWTYEWDCDRLCAMVEPNGARLSFTYDQAGQIATITNALGEVIERRYDDLGNVVEMELPDGALVAFEYDTLSRMTASTDADGARWEYGYSPNGGMSEIRDPMGGYATTAFSPANNMLTSTMFRAQRVKPESFALEFDSFGRITSVRDDESVAMLVRDAMGRIIERLLSDGSLIRHEYDAAGKLTATIDPEGLRTERSYNAAGRLARISYPDGTWVDYTYNADGQLESWTRSNGAYEQFDYDLSGKLVSRTSSARGTTTYTWNHDKIVHSSSLWAGERHFEYDLIGQLIAVRHGLGGVTRYQYDKRGRIIQITFPDGQVETRTYSGTNRLTSASKGEQSAFVTYDKRGRIASIVSPAGTTLSVVEEGENLDSFVDGRLARSVRRSANGRTVTVTDHLIGETHEMVYDRRGRLVSHTRDGQTTWWTYSPSGRRVSQTSPNGEVTRYTYLPNGELATIEHPALGEVSFGYDSDGALASMATPGGLHEWTYLRGLVSSHKRIDAEGVSETSILRDEAGRISAIIDCGQRTDYRYDAGGQLVSATNLESSWTWEYDSCGRILSETGPRGRVSYTYNAFGQLVSMSGPDGVTEFDYDEAGRRVRDRAGDRLTEYGWDVRGYLSQLTTTVGDDTTTTAITIDALGDVREVDGVTIAWDTARSIHVPIQYGDDPILALPGGMLWSDGESITWRRGRPSTLDNPWEIEQRGLVSAAGSITIGGVEKLGARLYQSSTRSFLSRDPLPGLADQAWGANDYSYAGNDPLNAIDPWGLRPATDADIDAYVATLPGSKWEYVVGGVLVGAGVAAIAIAGPVGPFLSSCLVSAGMSTITQKATTGSVDFTRAAIDGVIGGIAGSAGGAVASAMAARTGASALTSTVGQRMAVYAVDAGVSSTVETAGGYIVDTIQGKQGSAGDYATDFLTNFGTGLFASGIGGEWEHAGDIREAQRLSIVGEPYAGIKEASERMRELGIPREYRVQALQSFEPETVRLNTAGTDVYGLRYYGGGSNEFGRYVTDTLPATRQSLALPAENTMEHLSQFRLSEGAEYISGRVAPNFGQPGGGMQYYLLDNPENVLEVLK